MQKNIQDNNVGNIGDILKHAALVNLLPILKAEKNKVTCLDTHTYRLDSELANTDWQSDVDRYLSSYPAYRKYIECESKYVAQGRYRCSSGIMIDELDEPVLLLSERHQPTRELLTEQLEEESVSYMLEHELLDWPKRNDLSETDKLFVLFDPFEFNNNEWQAVTKIINSIFLDTGTGIIEAFTYQHQHRYLDWPEPPTSWLGPVSVIDQEPYHLAVYASRNISAEVTETLNQLGWSAQ